MKLVASDGSLYAVVRKMRNSSNYSDRSERRKFIERLNFSHVFRGVPFSGQLYHLTLVEILGFRDLNL